MYVPVKLVNTERFSEQNRSSVSVDKKVAQIKMDRLINGISYINSQYPWCRRSKAVLSIYGTRRLEIETYSVI